MAKRFGRNQKRALLAQIAKLQDTIDNLRGVIYEPATGKHPSLTSMGSVIEQKVTDEKSNYQIKRKAELVLWLGGGTGTDLHEWHRYSRNLIEWDGIVWIMTAIDFDHNRGFLGDGQVTVELLALGKGQARVTHRFETRHSQVGSMDRSMRNTISNRHFAEFNSSYRGLAQ